MKALTICQPYAHLIVRGEKRVENRTWPTKYRGPLAIHAGLSRDWLELHKPYPDIDPDREEDQRYGFAVHEMAWGALVGVADLVDCLHIDEIESGACDERHPWIRSHIHANGPWCWVLAEVWRLPTPITAKGAQGLWTPPAEAIAQLRGQP